MKHEEIISEVAKYIILDEVTSINKSCLSGTRLVKFYYDDEEAAKIDVDLLADHPTVKVSGRGVVKERKDYAKKFGKFSFVVCQRNIRK